MKKYLTLRSWHFERGTSFSFENFADYQRKAQKWADSAWIYFTIISIIPYIVLAFSIAVPRARKAQVAAARLGVTRQEINAALERLKNGTVAYEPSLEDRARWEDFFAKEALSREKEKAQKKPKVIKTWGIVLCAMGGVVGIQIIADLVSGSNAEGDLGSMLAGTVLFIGVGAYLINRSRKIVPGKEE